MGCCMTATTAESSQVKNPSQERAGVSHERSSRQQENRRREQRDHQQAGRPQGRSSRPAQSQNSAGLRITYLQVPQVEIIKQDKTVGKGVQKTLAYDTPFSKEQLENWRDEFWETRTSGSKQVWQLLKNACEADPDDAKALIEAAQLQLPQDSLTTAIDSAGVYYRVPICCIQLPDNYNQDIVMDALKAKKVPKEKQITIKVRCQKLGDASVTCSNLCSISQAKTAYVSLVQSQAQSTSSQVDINKLRFFSMGKELKDELYLYSYEIADNMVIQGMLRN